MNDIVKLLLLACMIAVLDLPWLYIQGPWVQDIVFNVQGDRSMVVRLWAAIPVYLAIAYAATQVANAPRAFLMGASIYAVYEFTQLVSFDKWPLAFAVADCLWGGVLMALTWWVGTQVNLLPISL